MAQTQYSLAIKGLFSAKIRTFLLPKLAACRRIELPLSSMKKVCIVLLTLGVLACQAPKEKIPEPM
ncbi:MAG TPA: hypothetical protein PLJ08_08315, partial [Cyclobacteriaceae bacterium]|nr:hypothetical protein [Cyclobacteriaceae bacterium]